MRSSAAMKAMKPVMVAMKVEAIMVSMGLSPVAALPWCLVDVVYY
jgi:hypothetical protein